MTRLANPLEARCRALALEAGLDPDSLLAHHAESVRILHRLRPFAVVMAGQGEFDPFKD